MNFGDYIGQRARSYGDRPAFITDERTVSFAEFDDRSNQFGRMLLAAGATPGDRVAVFVGNETAFFEVSFGVTKAGMAIVYVNFRLTAAELSYQLDNSGASILVVSNDLVDVANAADLSGVKEVIVLDDGYEERLVEHSADRLCIDVRDDDTCILVYTSGTTGRPKGAMQTHANWFAYTAATLIAFELGPDDRTLAAGPLVFSGRAMSCAALYRGIPQYILSSFEPATVLKAIEQHKITAVMLVPTMIYMLLEELEASTADTSSLRTIAYGAAPIAPEKLRRCLDHFGPVFVQVYGLSESPALCTLGKQEHVVGARHLGSAGRPVFGMEVVLRDEDGRDVDVGEIGEICARGPVRMAGYWDDPVKSAEKLVDGWLYTGDLGVRDEHGFIYIVDRRSDMIITGGSNVYPREVEDAITAHPSVAEVAVVAVPDEKWGEAVTAVVRAVQGQTITAAELEDLCRQTLAGYKIPKSFRFVDEPLPKSTHGKMLRREVRAQLAEAR